MKSFVIDCTQISDQSAFWKAYLDATNPEDGRYFGRNLDAFWDAIDGGGPGWPGECELHFVNTKHLRLLETEFFAGLERIAVKSRFVKLIFD
jgi:RNAse (barnase) inhibitor barstar